MFKTPKSHFTIESDTSHADWTVNSHLDSWKEPFESYLYEVRSCKAPKKKTDNYQGYKFN